jgi:hypothetical protein
MEALDIGQLQCGIGHRADLCKIPTRWGDV